MISAIRSEFRKLLTVRSTYTIVAASLAIVVLFAGLIQGYQAKAHDLLNPNLLASQSTSALVFVGLILAFAGLLLMGHEYRYTTIMYTLTSSNRRLKSLAAKFFVVTVFAVVTSLLVAFFSPLCTIIGAHLHGYTISPQSFDYWAVIWRCAFVGWGYALYAFILVTIMRNQIGAIVTFLLVPLIGENILMLLLKNNTKYLPFTALQSVADPSLVKGSTVSGGAITVLIYIGVGLLVSAILFSRRDAN
jgi:ABC-type transport system involved in multi-copper enzyme maturation permease subunit